MLTPGRHANTSSYRYGFQGQELDNEIKGEGNSLNYKFRMHDPRVGRFFAEDPLSFKYPHYSPYSFAGNKVIRFVELEGLEEFDPMTDGLYTIDGVPSPGAYTAEAILDAWYGAGNIMHVQNEWLAPDFIEGYMIKRILLDQGIELPHNIDLSTLGENFKVRARRSSGMEVIEVEDGILSDLFDVGIGFINIAGIFPGKGGVYVAISAKPLATREISKIISALSDKLKHLERFKRIRKIPDPDGGFLDEAESEALAIFEKQIRGQIKESTENGIDAFASGELGGVIFANRRISHVGTGLRELSNAEFNDWLSSFNRHFLDSSVGNFLVDIRHLKDGHKAIVKGIIAGKAEEIINKTVIIE